MRNNMFLMNWIDIYMTDAFLYKASVFDLCTFIYVFDLCVVTVA